MKPIDILLCLLTMFLWGAQVTAVKIAAGEIPLFLMLLIRFVIISVCLLPFMRRASFSTLSKMAIVALFSTSIHFSLLYQGIALIPAATSAIIYQLSPIFTVILAVSILGDKLTSSAILGITLSFCGIAMLFGGVDLKADLLGGILVALAALSFAIGTMLIKKLGPFDPVSMNGFSAIFSIPVMLVLTLTRETDSFASLTHVSTTAWLALLYAAISGGIIGFAIWYRLLNSYPITTLSPYTLLVPVFALAVSESLLREGLNLHFMFSALLVIIGVATTQFKVLERIGLKNSAT